MHSPMTAPFDIPASPAQQRALEALDELLTRLRMEHLFVGGVARAAWLGEQLNAGSIDALALLSSESKAQVPMMAMNRGFEVVREEVEAADELDLIPLGLRHEGQLVRCHVLVASNALYAMMFKRAVEAKAAERVIRVVGAEDLALLLLLSGDADSEETIRRLIEIAGSEFDVARWNERLTSIGLGHRTLA
jgi:hypothetical protein